MQLYQVVLKVVSVLDANALEQITSITIAHYDASSVGFWRGTRTHDVSQNRNALLRHLGGDGPFRILDLGCGPGRDLAAFVASGHEAVGLDGSENFCRMAREHSGCDVLHQDLLEMSLGPIPFDGVFANATLFHVPTQEISSVVSTLRDALKPDGVLFSSNPRGNNREGWQGDRYGAYHNHARWTALVTSCGFEELEHYYRPPGLPRHRQPWLATVFRKNER